MSLILEKRITKEEHEARLKATFHRCADELILDAKIASTVKRFVAEAVQDCFWELPAGEKHPAYQNGFGGVVLHSISCAKYAERHMLEHLDRGQFTQEEKDCIISACFIHDTAREAKNHGLAAASRFKEFSNLDEMQTRCICLGVANHMGPWAVVPPVELQVSNHQDFFTAYVVCCSDLVTSRNKYIDKEMKELFEASKYLGL
jgi:hypothetical protein